MAINVRTEFPPLPIPSPSPSPTAPPGPVTPPASTDPITTGIDLKEITQQLNGKPIPVSLGGRRRMGGYIIWGPKLRYGTVNGQPVKLWSFAVSFGFSADPDGVRDVLEIRFDSTIVYSAINNVVTPWLKWRFRPGTETQEPDAQAIAEQGSEATANRGQIIIDFIDVPSDSIPFVGSLIADGVTAGQTTTYFDTPTASTIRSIAAVDWAAGIAYGSGRETSYRLLAHRISDRSQISDLPIVNLSTAFTFLDETCFLWCPEAHVLLAMADSAAVVAIDPDSGKILAQTDAPFAFLVDGLLGGSFSYCKDTSTGVVVIAVACLDVTNNRLHVNVYDQSAQTITRIYKSTDNLEGLTSAVLTAVVRVPDTGAQARFFVAGGTKLVTADVDVAGEDVDLAVVHTAAAAINNLYTDTTDNNLVLFLSNGTALKLNATTYAVIWSTSPGFTVPSPNLTGNAYANMEGWRKTKPTFLYIETTGTTGFFYLDLTSGLATFQAFSPIGGHVVYDSATNRIIETDNGDPRTYSIPASSNDVISRSSALEKLAAFWGYGSGEFACVGVTGDWTAVIIAYDTTFQELLQLFKSVYPWDIIQGGDGVLRVVERPLGTSLTLDGTVTIHDIKESQGEQPAVTITQAEEVELPAITEIVYIDPARDYNWNAAQYKQPREPVAVTSSLSTQQIKLPVVMTMDDAKMLAASKSYRDRVARAQFSFSGMPSTIKYEPGDLLSIAAGVRTINPGKILTADAGSDWSMQFTGEFLLATGPLFDSGFWVAGVLPTDSGPTPTAPAVQTDGSEFVIYLDGPILAPSDDGAGQGLQIYYAVATRNAAGYTLRYAVFSYTLTPPMVTTGYVIRPVTVVPLYGALTTNIADTATPFVTDYVNSLTFKPVCGDTSALQALTYTELMNNTQMFAVGRPGRWEILGAGETVTSNADGTITLTGLMRGRRGSEVWCGAHEIGDQVLCLKAKGSSLAADAINHTTQFSFYGPISSLLGMTVYYASAVLMPLFGSSYTVPVELLGGRGTSSVQISYSFGAIFSSPITGTAEKPFAPYHLAAVISGSDIILDFDRRDRLDFGLGGGGDIPMSEAAELYDIEIMDGSSVKRTYTNQLPPPFTYPDADIVADFGSLPSELKYRSYQKSAVVGRGFAGEATITLS